MQRLIRRTALAKKQSENKTGKALKQKQYLEEKQARRQQGALDRLRLDAKRNERLNRREDWIRGPLAPRRDSGLDAHHYGAIAPTAVQAPTVPAHKRRKYINFAPGDSVCIMKGPDKGKISMITAVNAETETATVQDFNMVSVFSSRSF
jgi:large subunit ribosomal protein L24